MSRDVWEKDVRDLGKNMSALLLGSTCDAVKDVWTRK